MLGGTLTHELSSCRCKEHGQQSLYGHLNTNINSRPSNRRHQATCPPLGPHVFVKPCLGTNTSHCFHSRHGFHTIHSENSPVKPRIVTVVKPGNHPMRKITLLLNRRSVQTFEQLVADISEALGFPRWKNDRVRKLYNLKGKEIRSVSDFFRGDDAFIALGREQLTLKNIEIAVNELFPDTSLKQSKEHHEKLCKVDYKGGDSGHEERSITNNRGEIVSPSVITKNTGNIRTNSRAKNTRILKHGAEKCKVDQEKTSEFLKNVESCHSKQEHSNIKISTASLNDIGCEKCVACEHIKDYGYKQKCNSKLKNDKSLEDTATTELQRCNLEETECCRNFPLNNSLTSIVTCEACTSKLEEDDLVRYGKLNWHKNKMQKKSKNTHRKEHFKGQCQLTRYTMIKPTDQFIEDFLENTNKKMCLEEEKITVGNCNNQDAINTIETQTPKTPLQLSKNNEETDGFQINKTCYTKETVNIEHYYEIGRVIGDGNFAVVKECRPRKVNMEYAMKIIDKSKLKGKEYIIDNEVRIIKCLSHPNIVRLLDNYETETEIYLIMEYIKGGDLFDAITESVKFTEHDAAFMLADLCEALLYIHNKNIVHRDVKPENLLVQHNTDGTTTLKLADFGLAVYVTEPIFTVCGTPTYVAPEILSERGYGLEVDMWASGVILYILLCGFPPFRSFEHNQEELFNIIQCGEYEFLSPYWDHISDDAKDLISKLLVLNPLKRYSAKCVLHHNWVCSYGLMNNQNLQRDVTMNIEQNFRNRRKKEVTSDDLRHSGFQTSAVSESN
ncbi:serine/threonine-protein kinase DCLK3 [Spea bombifrons]|uniref:serine/threonine-protein kinase DCLK3 n=1 Tax=Spea bombifrons TaxID=233779 RepID=UPI00234BF687|nr:serine/threonine-protein kinase DCLK3 [Spea bombifrons]